MQSKEGLSNIEAKAIDGNLYCKFSRESSFTVNNIDFDLKNSHHLLLSLGSATECKSILLNLFHLLYIV